VLAVVGSSICLFYLMDRVPRRKLIIGGFIATTTCHALIVISSYLLPEGLAKAFVILIFMVLFVFCMQLATSNSSCVAARCGSSTARAVIRIQTEILPGLVPGH
jgi:hypothetical protein